jgi:hypothetical protein
MTQVDRAVEWATGYLSAAYAGWLVVPALFLVLYVVTSTLLRRVVPVLLTQLVVPVTVLAVGVVGVGALTVEFVSGQPFRLFRRPPPRLLYTVGDLTVATVTLLQRQIRGLGYQARRMRWLRAWAPLLATIAVLTLWNNGWCDRHATPTSCTAPVAAWQTRVADWWQDRLG